MEKHLTFLAPQHTTIKVKNTASGFTQTMSDSDESINVRQIIDLCPFIANAIIVSREKNPVLICIIVASAIEANNALLYESYHHADLDEEFQHEPGWFLVRILFLSTQDILN